MSHNERCKDCKIRFREMLEVIFGPVQTNYRVYLKTLPENYQGKSCHKPLSDIYLALQNHRGFNKFVMASYVDLDYFVPSLNCAIEFDESQHFTNAREISLTHYPQSIPLAFSKDDWIKRCKEIHARDNDPPYRDEQRAWCDTLRDFLPVIKGFNPTFRLYSRELKLCSLNPEKVEDVEKFKDILEGEKLIMDSKNEPAALCDAIAQQPIINMMIRFEYLTNKLKLQYLLDCTTGQFDHDSRYFQKIKENPKILNTGGRAYKAYFNFRFQFIGYLGPLFKGLDPGQSDIVKELNRVNENLKQSIYCSDDWFRLFCEYTLIKISVHELISDIHDPENLSKYGYPDLMKIREIERNKIICGSILRDFVVHCLNIGINPSEQHEGIEHHVDHLANCKYAEFQAQRNEWLQFAWYYINRIKSKMTTQNLKNVMQWNTYSPCAYETGPVFIRKQKKLLLSSLIPSFETHQGWNQGTIRDNLHEIVEKDVYLLIDSYWDYFKGEQTVGFFEANSVLATKIKQIEQQLDDYYREFDFKPESVEDKGPSPILFGQSMKMPKTISYVKPELKKIKTNLTKQAPALQNEVTKPGFIEIPKNKFSPGFYDVIQYYCHLIPDDFHIIYTSSKTNCIIRSNIMPKGIQYEFDDWNDKGKPEFSVEICFRQETFKSIGELIQTHKSEIANRMPCSSKANWDTTSTKDWNRLKFIFVDSTDPALIAKSMSILIEETKEIVNSWLLSKNMEHYLLL